MLKKVSIILFIAFCFLCVSNFCFATDNNMGNNIKNTVGSGVNTVVDGVGNLAEDARNGVGHIENGIENTFNMDNGDNRNDNAGNYNATRTAITDSGNNGGMLGIDTTTMWIWVILAIAAIVIVGLVWYYGSQNNID